MNKEIEMKFLDIDEDLLRDKFKEIGASLVHEKRLMKRSTFDFKNIELQKGEYKWLRVRDEGDKITMTLKHLFDEQRIVNTEEIEIEVNDFEKAKQMVLELEMKLTNTQENYRERWVYNNVELTIDTWPGLNPLLEIEAETEERVREVARILGFDLRKAIFGTIDYAYQKALNTPLEFIVKLRELTFITIKKY